MNRTHCRRWRSIACATAVALAPCHAVRAQNATTNADDATLLFPYSTYLESSAGRALLQANLATVIAINNSATAAQQALAFHDDINVGSTQQRLGVVVADGLGPQLAAALNAAIVAGAPALGSNGSVFTTFSVAQGTTGGDAGFAKTFFGTGSAAVTDSNGNVLYTVPVALPGGATANVNYYAFLAPGPNPNGEGNPRPYQVAPGGILAFSGALYIPPSIGSPAGVGGIDTSKKAFSDNSGSASFPSGHSTFGNTAALLLAIAIPERFQQSLTRGSEFQFSRNVLGVHYPMDSIGGRIIALHDVTELLNGNPSYGASFPAQFAQATTDLRSILAAGCGGSIAACLAHNSGDRFADTAQNRADYVYRLTYGLPSVGPTDSAPVVPAGAEILLATRFPYLTGAQRRDVLASTELPSGVPLDDGSGWARLNLYTAASGYGAFNGLVTVTMNAADGGFSALDTWDNDIGGAGGLIKAGTGTLILAGRDSYSGGTTLQAGILALSGTLAGSLAIAPGATFMTNGGYAVAAGATLMNGGRFTGLAGAGTLTSAGTMANSGVLDSTLVNTGVAMNAGVITGAVTSTGTLINTGTLLAGLTAQNGSVVNNGTVMGDTVSAGTLSGNGTYTGNLTVSGVVAPGNSIGTIAVGGNLTVAGAAVYQVQLGPAGISDRIDVTGHADILPGATVTLNPYAGYTPGFGHYTILTATGGLTGTFGTVTPPYDPAAYPFLGSSLSYAADSVTAVVGRGASFAAAGTTRNQIAAGLALDSLPLSNSTLAAAALLDYAHAPAALGTLAGDIYASVLTGLQNQSSFLRDAVIGRLRGAFGSDERSPSAVRLSGNSPVTIWQQAIGEWGSNASDGNAARLDRSTGGTLIGADMALGDHWRAGFVTGVDGSFMDTDAGAAKARLTDVHAGLYGGAQFGRARLSFGGTYTNASGSASRTVLFPGFADAETSGLYGQTEQAFAEASTTTSWHSLRLLPFVRLAFVHVHADDFNEGSGAAALSGHGGTLDVGYGTAGGRAALPFVVAGHPVVADATVGVQHVFGNTLPTRQLVFSGAPFTVAGVPVARDRAVLGAGLSTALSGAVEIGLRYSGEYGSGQQTSSAAGSLLVRF